MANNASSNKESQIKTLLFPKQNTVLKAYSKSEDQIEPHFK